MMHQDSLEPAAIRFTLERLQYAITHLKSDSKIESMQLISIISNSA